MDPTSNQGKNASVSCFKIREVLALFRGVYEKLVAAKELVAARFEEFLAAKVRAHGAEWLAQASSSDLPVAEIEEALGMRASKTESENGAKPRSFLEGILGLVDFSAGSVLPEEN